MVLAHPWEILNPPLDSLSFTETRRSLHTINRLCVNAKFIENESHNENLFNIPEIFLSSDFPHGTSAGFGICSRVTKYLTENYFFVQRE